MHSWINIEAIREDTRDHDDDDRGNTSDITCCHRDERMSHSIAFGCLPVSTMTLDLDILHRRRTTPKQPDCCRGYGGIYPGHPASWTGKVPDIHPTTILVG